MTRKRTVIKVFFGGGNTQKLPGKRWLEIQQDSFMKKRVEIILNTRGEDKIIIKNTGQDKTRGQVAGCLKYRNIEGTQKTTLPMGEKKPMGKGKMF